MSRAVLLKKHLQGEGGGGKENGIPWGQTENVIAWGQTDIEMWANERHKLN